MVDRERRKGRGCLLPRRALRAVRRSRNDANRGIFRRPDSDTIQDARSGLGRCLRFGWPLPADDKPAVVAERERLKR
jgi:hypothetical protein